MRLAGTQDFVSLRSVLTTPVTRLMAVGSCSAVSRQSFVAAWPDCEEKIACLATMRLASPELCLGKCSQRATFRMWWPRTLEKGKVRQFKDPRRHPNRLAACMRVGGIWLI